MSEKFKDLIEKIETMQIDNMPVNANCISGVNPTPNTLGIFCEYCHFPALSE
mgnify:CR=1 FL=1